MGAGASAGGAAAPFESAEAALAAGKTQEEVDTWMASQATTTAAAAAEAASPAEAAPSEAEAAAAGAEESAASDTNIIDCDLKNFQAAVDAAIAEGKWPLLLDSNENTPLVSFLQYQSFTLVEVKKGMVESCIQKTKTVEEVQEEWRKTISSCMIQKSDLGSSPGRCLWLHFADRCVVLKNDCFGYHQIFRSIPSILHISELVHGLLLTLLTLTYKTYSWFLSFSSIFCFTPYSTTVQRTFSISLQTRRRCRLSCLIVTLCLTKK